MSDLPEGDVRPLPVCAVCDAPVASVRHTIAAVDGEIIPALLVECHGARALVPQLLGYSFGGSAGTVFEDQARQLAEPIDL